MTESTLANSTTNANQYAAVTLCHAYTHQCVFSSVEFCFSEKIKFIPIITHTDREIDYALIFIGNACN